MKVLTIFQPWASLIVLGAKPYEFRGWDYATRFRSLVGQRVVIHAACRPIKHREICDTLERIAADESSLVKEIAVPLLERVRDAHKCRGVLETGAGLGTAILGRPESVTTLFADKVADSDRLDHSLFAWPLTEINRWAEPIPMRGYQGFWNWPEKVDA